MTTKAITPLRQRMIEDMTARKRSELDRQRDPPQPSRPLRDGPS
jgi:hypothetical protein